MTNPPRLPTALLRRVLHSDEVGQSILGDVREDFVLVAERRGAFLARCWYWHEAIRLTFSILFKRAIDMLHAPRHPLDSEESMAASLRSGLLQDIRYTLRGIRREPAFFGLVVLIVGLGIGAGTAVFSVASPLMLRALPFAEPDQLVWVANSGDPNNGMSAVASRTSNLRDFRRLNQSFDGMTGYNPFFQQGGYNLVGSGDPERLVGVSVAQDFFDVLGVRPLVGRSFAAGEGEAGGPAVAMFTYGFWAQRFGADPSIVGSTISLNDVTTEVIGVLPRSFDFSSTFSPNTTVDFFRVWPISDETDQTGNSTSMIARLRPGVTVEMAQQDLDRIIEGLTEAEPDRWGLGARVTSLRDQITGSYRSAMVLLGAAAATVVMIVCVNLSNLLLAKGSKRSKEMGVRSALGATRTRLLRQLVVESLVLAMCGGLLGTVMAFGATLLVTRSEGLGIPLIRSASVDGTALLFTLGLAIVSGLFIGFVPALQATTGGGAAAMNDASRGSSVGRQGTMLRQVLVVTEVAMACMLLVFGGLFLKSFRNVLDVEMGYQPSGAVGWTVSPSRSFESLAEANAYYAQMTDHVAAIPGVESVGLVDALPLGRNRTWGWMRAVGYDYEEGELRSVFPHIVDDQYIQTMGIPLIAGRHLSVDDVESADLVVVLNESAANGVFRGADPLDKQVRVVGREFRVVGVVADVRHQSLELGSGWQAYFPYTQVWSFRTLDMVVRSRLPVETLAPSVASAMRRADPSVPTAEFESLAHVVDRSVSPRRFVLLLLGLFGGTALVLAALGVYGVLSFWVTERTPEIGIRMALGATGRNVLGRVVGQTMALAGIGVVVGAVGSFVGTRFIGSLLYGVNPNDPTIFLVMAVILLSVAGLAGFIPARRASRVDPAAAFRPI